MAKNFTPSELEVQIIASLVAAAMFFLQLGCEEIQQASGLLVTEDGKCHSWSIECRVSTGLILEKMNMYKGFCGLVHYFGPFSHKILYSSTMNSINEEFPWSEKKYCVNLNRSIHLQMISNLIFMLEPMGYFFKWQLPMGLPHVVVGRIK